MAATNGMGMRRYLSRAKKRMFHTVWAVEGVWDRRRLQDRIPALDGRWKASAIEISSEMRPFHHKYVTEVSNPDSAISLELAAFLVLMCDSAKPRRILDLGSGFSSFVFRRCQRQASHAPEVWSIDDDPEWLEQTRRFLQAHGLGQGVLETWDSFCARDAGLFDLVLYDLGNMTARSAQLARVLEHVDPAGVLILDDFHRYDYRIHVRRLLQEVPHRAYSLYAYTRDGNGRHSALVTDLQART